MPLLIVNILLQDKRFFPIVYIKCPLVANLTSFPNILHFPRRGPETV